MRTNVDSANAVLTPGNLFEKVWLSSRFAIGGNRTVRSHETVRRRTLRKPDRGKRAGARLCVGLVLLCPTTRIVNGARQSSRVCVRVACPAYVVRYWRLTEIPSTASQGPCVGRSLWQRKRDAEPQGLLGAGLVQHQVPVWPRTGHWTPLKT